MSVAAISWVFGLDGDDAPKLGTRLVLLALADNAGAAADYDDAHVAWPAVETIAHKALLSKRQTQYALKQLRDGGLIRAVDTSPSGTTVYRLMLERGADIAPPQNPQGAIRDTNGVHSIAPESSVEPSVDESLRDSCDDDAGQDQTSPTTSPTDDSPTPPVSAAPPPVPYADAKTEGARHAPQLAIVLARHMRGNDPKAKLPDCFVLSADGAPDVIDASKSSAKGWLDPFRLLIDRDERDPEEVRRVLVWSQRDEFWKGNILSPSKFRTQFAKLMFAADRNAGAVSSPRNAPSQRDQAQALKDWINKAAGTSRADLDRRTGVHH